MIVDGRLAGVEAHGAQPLHECRPVLGGGDHDGPAPLVEALGDEARELVHDDLVLDVEGHRMGMRFQGRLFPHLLSVCPRWPGRQCQERSCCGCRMPASSSTPSTSRVPGRAQAALASTACTGTPAGSALLSTSRSASAWAPARS